MAMFVSFSLHRQIKLCETSTAVTGCKLPRFYIENTLHEQGIVSNFVIETKLRCCEQAHSKNKEYKMCMTIMLNAVDWTICNTKVYFDQ